MNLIRIWVLTLNVFREVIRDRILYLIVLYTLLLIAANLLLPEVSAGAQGKILKDLGLAMIEILTVIVAIFIGTGLINRELDKKTILVLIPKPLTITEFILGKHLGLTSVLGVLVLGMTIVYLSVITANSIPYPLGAILLSNLYLLLQLSLIVAIALVFGVFTSSLLATLLTLGMYLVGHGSDDMIRLIKLAKNPALEQLTYNLYLILPDLSRLNLKNEAVYGALPSSDTLLINAIWAILYMSFLLGIATFIFSKREF